LTRISHGVPPSLDSSTRSAALAIRAPVHLVHDATRHPRGNAKYINGPFTILTARARRSIDRPFRPSRKVRAENHGGGGWSIRRFARREGKLAGPTKRPTKRRGRILRREEGREEPRLSLFLRAAREREREREEGKEMISCVRVHGHTEQANHW